MMTDKQIECARRNAREDSKDEFIGFTILTLFLSLVIVGLVIYFKFAIDKGCII